jgi:hypothetical protein
LLTFAALAVDGGLSMDERRDLQAYADNAAAAGGRTLAGSGVVITKINQADYIAMQYLASRLGFSIPLGACISATVCPPGAPYSAGTYTITLADDGTILDVSLTHQRTNVLAGPAGFTNTLVGAAARFEGPQPPSTCVVCLLAKTGLSLNIESSGAGIQAQAPTGYGGLQVDSSQCPANNFNGNSTKISAPSASFSGCAGGPATNYVHPDGTPMTPLNNQPVAPDPLGAVPEPVFCTPVCANYGVGAVHGTITSDSGTVTLSPGIYSEFHPTGSNIILNPGLYILTGDGNDGASKALLEDSNGKLLATGGVTIFFTCPSFKSGSWCGSLPDGGTHDPGFKDCNTSTGVGAGIEMSSNGNLGVTAPSSGPYQGMAIFFDRCNNATIHMTADGSQAITGAFYAKSSQVVLTSSASQVVVNGIFVAKSVDLQSNAGIKVNFDPTNLAENSVFFFSHGPARGLSR